jgi:hypothetical protein
MLKLTDQYDRQARLYPALLAGATLVTIAVGVYGLPLEPKAGLIGLLASCGVVFLLTTIARELGKLNIPFPTAPEELTNPPAADAIYASAARWLLDLMVRSGRPLTVTT